VSFLVDPPLLVGAGAAIGALAPDEQVARQASRAVTALFVGVSLALYLDAPGMDWFWRSLRARSGRDWMLNSGLFHFEYRRPRPQTHALAAALFATYPLWPKVGYGLSRRSQKLAKRPADSGEGVELVGARSRA